jgi:subtilisin-like proprotein convertase family protein
MRKLFSLLFAVIAFVAVTNAQDAPHSVGPAPVQTVQAPVNADFDASVGKRYFSQISSSPTFQFGKAFTESCTITNVGAPFTITFPGGLMYRNGIVYTYNQSSPFQLWSIDTTTGTHTLVFNMTGVPQANFTGMVWDGTDVYGLSTSITQSQIFRINMTTGACTPVGSASAVCAGGITLLGRTGAQYSLFALDIVADNLYKVNKTTGVFTLVGPLGQNLNFGQDGSVDNSDNAFYAMCYAVGPELRRVDTTTGTLSAVLCTYTAQATGMAILPPGAPPPPPGFQTTICRTVNVPINDHQTARDSLQVALGNACVILDVNVRIGSVTHTWDSDLSFYLQKGTVGAKIINKVGGSGDNFTNTVLNDSATTPIASGTAPFTGNFIPSAPLAPFNFGAGLGDGYWKLVITDTATGDTGALTNWCLIVTYNCPVGGIQTIEIPNFYSLSQNYPNPFNPSTSIKFSMPKGDNVKLVIFDILGREVKTLVNEFKNAGSYDVNFDASTLSSGVYFYRLEAGEFTDTKRMLLVK